MTFEEEVEKLSEEYYPGSKRKIERSDDDTAADPSDGWDAKPRVYKKDGKDTEFFTVGHLAMAMNRKPLTIRQWERRGIIPKSTFQRAGRNGSQHGRRRLYTRAQIEGMIQIAAEEGLLSNDRREIASTNFKARVLKLFKDLAAKDLAR